MGGFHAASGAFFAIAWFLFGDGAYSAGLMAGTSYKFVEWLPGLLCIVAMVLFAFVDTEQLQQSGNGIYGGFSTPEDQMRQKILFFFASIVALAGVTVAIWMLAQNYNTSDKSWPGVALLLQSFALIASAGLLVGSKIKRSTDDDWNTVG